MERIKQAIEQAARERMDSRALTPRDPSRLAKGAGKVNYVPPGEVKFTATRTIQVSQATRERNRLAASIPGHPLRDTYRMLRTRVLQELKANSWNCIAVTSPVQGCGKTLTAINLAISLAMDHSHLVMLVDGDMRKPSIHTYFDYEPEFGIHDCLFADVPLSSALFHPGIERLTVLPGRVAIDDSAEVLSSPQGQGLIKELRTRYPDRIIVVDVPPVLAVDDALSLAPNIDCMLMVAENGKTTREELYRALDLLDGIPLLGTVLNKSDIKTAAAY
ncbi:MAG: CpsD/CapB family tyrosine-protein kinase [Gammaproteobacteria bacterium]|jgi:capsular exopolysaccharide synthesis family protein|nr:CpsD/CapB family tyrosine-protein kinase [Gammaproteobacteria bacterium]